MSIFDAGGLRVEYATLSRLGKRLVNEDACGYWVENTGSCFIVSDGAGGNGGGDVASEMAVRTMLSAFSSSPTLESTQIEDLIHRADAAVRYGQSLSQNLSRMSATVAALFFDAKAEYAQLGHLGDTRIYLFRRGQCYLMTKDHSLVQQFVDAGLLSDKSTREHSERSVLFAALGGVKEFAATVLDAPVKIEEGDVFLICSDGFWEAVEEEDMLNCLAQADAAEEWLVRMEQILIDKNCSEQDNYTALAVWAGSPNDITVHWSGMNLDNTKTS